MSIPQSIIDDAYELDGTAKVDLYRLELTNAVVVALSPKKQYVWQGLTYEEVPCTLSQIARAADGELTRPKFSVVNPNGLFTSSVHNRVLENADLYHIQAMLPDVIADNGLALVRQYRITRVLSVTKEVIVLEARGMLDGAFFRLPNEAFYPPAFPHVSLR